MTENSPEGLGKAWSWGKDILVLLVVPVLIWTVEVRGGECPKGPSYSPVGGRDDSPGVPHR